jgi:hypothetical protein
MIIGQILGSDHWNILSTIVSASTDSAPVMHKAVELLKVTRFPCAAHGLHNCVKNAMENCEELQALKIKCHDLAMTFHNSPKLAQGLQQEQEQTDPESPPLVVVLDVVTRWNSTLLMLQRLYRLKSSLETFIFGMISQPTPENRVTVKRLSELRLTTSEWEQVEQVIGILKPFEDLTLVFSSSSVRGLAACVAPWVYGLISDLERDDGPASTVMSGFRLRLLDEVKTRLKITDKYLLASALHPTFNNLWFVEDEARINKVKAMLRDEYNGLFPQDDAVHTDRFQHESRSALHDEQAGGSSGLHKLLKRRRLQCETYTSNEGPTTEEFDRYFKLDLKGTMVDPMEWWRDNRTTFPVMARLARKYLGIPATSVASERMFSYSGNIATDKRNRLKDDTVSDLVFCHYAAKCLKVADAYANGGEM